MRPRSQLDGGLIRTASSTTTPTRSAKEAICRGTLARLDSVACAGRPSVAVLLPVLTLGPGAGAAQIRRRQPDGHDPEPLFRCNLDPVIAATTPTEFFTRVAAALTQAQATDFAGRAKAWAAEIDLARPDLIGLQEAVLWRTQSPADFSPTPNATTVEADFVALLLAELRARGLKYDLVIAQTGYDVEAPGLFATGFKDVRLTQREVILARRTGALKLANAQGGQYAAKISIPTVIGVPVQLPWGWASVDATFHGQTFRFATTHLDPISGAAQVAQANEFLAGPGATTLPIIWVGDFNSNAEGTAITGVPSATATYGNIVAAGFSDAWRAKHPTDPGFTCCHETDLLNPTPALTERIDLVLTKASFGVAEATIVGDEVADRLPSGLWPSDHAGVVVSFKFDEDEQN